MNTPTLRTTTPDTHVKIRFKDRYARISRLIVLISVSIMLGAFLILSLLLKNNLAQQEKLQTIISLAKTQNNNVSVAKQIYDTMQKVSASTNLPEGELPVFATISDASKLIAQPLFKNAINGDQILFYTKAQKVYIFRPSSQELISEGPFTMPIVTPTIPQ